MNIPKILKKCNIKYCIGPCKNVGIDVVGVNCPFCSSHGLTLDKSFHCGIFENGIFSCWRCNESGNLYKLLNKLCSITYDEYKDLVVSSDKHTTQDTTKSIIHNNLNKHVEEKKEEIECPAILHDLKPNRFIEVDNWCKRRQFNIELLKAYNVKYCDRGKFAYRLIIPIYDIENNYAGFQAADVTGNSSSKYTFPRGFSANNHLYNLNNNLNCENLIIVEGVTDVWRIEQNAICSFGKQLSPEQRALLLDMNKEIVVAWDSDGFNQANREVAWWQELGYNARCIELPEGFDPDKFIKDKGLEKWQKLLKNC